MSTIRALLAIGGVAISGAAGCAQPGIVEVHEMTPAQGAVGTDAAVAVPVQDTGVPVVVPVQDTGVAVPVQDTGVAVPVQDTGVAVPVQDASVPKDAGPADTGPAPIPPCPTGYTCQDPGAMIRSLGASGGVVDGDGGTVNLSCGKGGIQDCDRTNPKKSCPDFVNPFCAHLTIEFPPLDSWTCAQICKN